MVAAYAQKHVTATHNIEQLDIWSNEYFLQLADRITFC